MNPLLAVRPALRLNRFPASSSAHTLRVSCAFRVPPPTTTTRPGRRAFTTRTTPRAKESDGRPTTTTTGSVMGVADPEQALRAQSGGRLGLSPATPDMLDSELYFKTWHTEEVDHAFKARDQSYVDYVVTALASDAGQGFMDGLSGKAEEEFKDIWAAFSELDPAEYLDDLLAFMLHHGVRLLPPTSASYAPETAIVLLTDGEKKQVRAVAKTPEKFLTPLDIFPDLREASPLLDPQDIVDYPPTPDNPFHNRVIVRNHRSVFHEYANTPEEALTEKFQDQLAERNDRNSATTEETSDESLMKDLPVSEAYYSKLNQSILFRRSVLQQTGKGKIRRVAFLVLVGDGNGLVGYGEGKHANAGVALAKARVQAVRNMDYVYRFENRTIWTEMKTKLGSTELIFRPRPVGFGLRCNPYLHKILRAAGFKDISAKVWGSRNRLNVIKGAFRLLHAGHAPTGMGDGVGGKGQKLAKGRGMQSKAEVERARGRKLVSLRK